MNKSMKRDSKMQQVGHSNPSPHKQKLQWQQIKTPSTIINRRSCHSSCVFKNKLYVYGGYDNNQPDILNNFYAFCFLTNRWEEVPQKGDLPGRRHSQSAILYDEKMYMFGGVYQFMTNTNQLHIFDFKTHTWTLAKTKATPPPIDSHRCCLYQNQMIVGLGYSQNQYNPHIYSLDLTTLTWKKIFNAKNVPSQTYPQPRANGSFTVNNHQILIYGGRNFYETFSDFWSFDLIKLTFQKIELFNQPEGRFGHSAIANDNKLYIFGGTRGVTHERNDLIMIDLAKKYVKTCWADSQQQRRRLKQQTQIVKKTRRDSASKKCQFKNCQDSNISEKQGSSYQSPQKYRTQLKDVSYYNELYDSRRKKADFKKKAHKNPLLSEIHEFSQQKEGQNLSLTATFQILTNSIMLMQGKGQGKQQKSEQSASDCWRHIPKARDNYSVDLWKNEQEIYMIVFGGGMHKIGFNDIIKIDLRALNHKYQLR